MAATEDVVRRFWGSVWTDGHVSDLHEILAPDFRENGEHVDVEEFARAVVQLRTIFTDFSSSVEQLFEVSEDTIVTRVTYRGTQDRSWAGIPPTGRSFESVGIDIFTVREGRIVELWHAVDHYDMAVQLGGRLVPAAEPASGY